MIVICVPTPLTETREPDLSFVQQTAAEISRVLRSGQVVILESTSYPGTTEEVLKPILEKSGLVSGRDFLLAFSPSAKTLEMQRFRQQPFPKWLAAMDRMHSLLLANFMPPSSRWSFRYRRPQRRRP